MHMHLFELHSVRYQFNFLTMVQSCHYLQHYSFFEMFFYPVTFKTEVFRPSY